MALTYTVGSMVLLNSPTVSGAQGPCEAGLYLITGAGDGSTTIVVTSLASPGQGPLTVKRSQANSTYAST